MSTQPPEFKSEQYEFSEEHNRMINDLAGSMSVVATLMKVTGLAFLLIFALLLWHAIDKKGPYGAVIGLGAAMLFCLAVGFWTGGAAHSFRRIVESKNRDVWHLMSALDSLHSMYGLLRTLIIGSLILVGIGFILLLFERFSN
jgi:hypothetical protein